MATCKSCGAELKPNAKFCPECGTVIEESTVIENEAAKPVEQEAAPTAETAATEKSDETKPEETAAVQTGSEKETNTDIETHAEDEIEKTIEAAAEAAAELPQVKEISIIKPKDISVLKPKKAEIIQKKPASPPPAPVPTAAAVKTAENSVQQDTPKPEAKTEIPPKRVIPDVELPEEPKMPVDSADDGPLPVVSSFMNKREEDFGKDFYSDISVKNKPSEKKSEETHTPESKEIKEAPPAPEPAKKKKSPVGAIIAVIVILAAAAAGYYLYSQGYFGDIGGSDTVPVAETTVAPQTSADTLSQTELTSESDTETSESLSSASSADTSATSLVSSETSASSESASDTAPASETETQPTAENLSDISLTFTHAQSVGGSEILNYSLADNADNFSVSNMTDTSQLIVDYTSSVAAGNNMSPINMYISDGTSKEVVASSSVTETQVTYDYSMIRDTAEAVGFADGINSIVSISFSGVGFPVDVTSIIITNCIS
ncbi:MAG: zinc ribbon domain-containing protein [Oscillospiraceae bacterium]